MHAWFGPEPRPVPPGVYRRWEEALALLNRDLAVTLPGKGPLCLLALPPHDDGEPEQVYVALSNGEWHGNPLYADSVQDPQSALMAVADAAQETITERLWQAWPICPEHDLGMHARETADGPLSWWCAGERLRHGSAHILTAVGSLDTLFPAPRPHRKRPRES